MRPDWSDVSSPPRILFHGTHTGGGISSRYRPARSGAGSRSPSAGDSMRAFASLACGLMALAVLVLPPAASSTGLAGGRGAASPVDSPTVRLDLAGLKQRLETGG